MAYHETLKGRQISELQVLKSIFGEELRDIRKSKQKKKWQPIDVIITLTPQVGSGPVEAYAQIDLHVICGERYPEEIPKIFLENSRGLSDQQVMAHLSELEVLADKLKGEVMIFDLAQQVKKFLHENNKPGYTSCYDEMVSKREERKQCELQEKQLKEDKERQIIQDEILKRKEALKEELRCRRESTRMTQSFDSEFHALSQSIPSSPHERLRTYSRRRCMSTSECSDALLCDHRGIKVLRFDNNKGGERQVHRGNCLGHSTKGSVVYSGVDMSTGELLAVTEWTINCRNSIEGQENNGIVSNVQNILKQVMSIEQELNHLNKLLHPNLVHYLNILYQQDDENIVVYILQEFVVGTTCSFYLSENITVEIDMLRYLAAGILTALKYLHENNVVHKDLRDSSVYITSRGIKLSDYSLDKRLSDIYQSFNLAKLEQDFPTSHGRGGKKSDIYRFGILLLSLYKGAIVSEEEIKEISFLETINDKPQLKDFISNCLVSNERNRWSADQLLEHCFIHTPIERGLSPPRVNYNNDKKKIQPEQEPHLDAHLQLPAFGGQSRIQNEFEILKWLGKGAFGDVLKVQNKLDGGIYAIKRIKLNPKNKQLNRKITREVKLLSRLNHENVVRYYNSWIESAIVDHQHSRYTPSVTPSSIKFASESKDQNVSEKNSYYADIEKLVPPTHDVTWNVSYKSRVSTTVSANDSEEDNSESSTDSESDEDWSFIMKTKNTSNSSDCIEFERGSEEQNESDINCDALSVENKNVFRSNGESKCMSPIKEIQFMYIQMEFCEKSTLRTAIDNGLYEDEERIWRLFREIIEGLVHIHQQGMIHRDLKPVNIFLDSNDHVKIGDFGLATSNILSSLNQTIDTEKDSQITDKGCSFDNEELGSMTGQVGTALYAAPELTVKVPQAIYNQKVDLYSLGIIFFEMCYKPLITGMERVKILVNLRSKEIIIPDDLVNSNKVNILRSLLNHDPSQRPTSQELLLSEYLPPLRLEETELTEMIRRTLSNSKSKAYKCLMDCCFKQEFTPAEDITYDMNIPTRNSKNSLASLRNFIQEIIKSKVLEIFRKHGGVNIATPLFMPKCGTLYNFTDSCVRLMTRNGNIVSLPHDLRAPFARYITWNNISNIRRYAIERVYREKKIHGFHPRELYECAFDIISSFPRNLMAEAELICIAWEICNEISQLKDREFTVRINHTSILHAVLEYCGVEKERYQDIYSILRDALDGKFSKFQLHTHLFSLCLRDQAMETLYNLLEVESSGTKIASFLKAISRRKGDIGEFAREGLKDIETVITNAEALGVTWPITIIPVLVHNIQQYNGIIFQVTCKLKKRRRIGEDVIAAGGRYDNMLQSFQRVLERTGSGSKEMKRYGVGISLSLEKLICAVNDITENFTYGENRVGIDIAVCCIGDHNDLMKEKEFPELLHELWSLGMKVTCLDFYKLEEALEYCRDNFIHNVIVKTSEKDYLRLQTWERDRFQERKITIKDLPDYFQKHPDVVSSQVANNLNKSDSKINSSNEFAMSQYNMPININVNFIFSDKERLSGNNKRTFKNTMLSQMSSHLQRLSHKVPIEVFGVFLEMSVLRTIVNFLEIDEDEPDLQKSIQLIIERHPRNKKYIERICEEMFDIRNQKLKPILILYSLTDYRYVTLL